MIRTACARGVPPDGLGFHPETVRGERIREDQRYEGVRVKVLATLGRARAMLQIDVGFGDVVRAALDGAADRPPARAIRRIRR